MLRRLGWFPDHLRKIPWEDSFKLGASAVAAEFSERVQVGVDIYNSHRKYQIKLHLSPWFLAACAAVVHIEITSFNCTNKSPASKV